jgi:MoxR-like ATPase
MRSTERQSAVGFIRSHAGKQVTIGDTFKLDRPSLSIGKIQLNKKVPAPEAQVDRFMLKTVIDYPKMDEERMVVRQNLKGSYEKVNQVFQ